MPARRSAASPFIASYRLRFQLRRVERKRSGKRGVGDFHLTTITKLVVPSTVLPLNLLLLADSAVPLIAVEFWKKSLFESRTVPELTFTPIELLANMLSSMLMVLPVLALTAPLTPPVVPPK